MKFSVKQVGQVLLLQIEYGTLLLRSIKTKKFVPLKISNYGNQKIQRLCLTLSFLMS